MQAALNILVRWRPQPWFVCGRLKGIGSREKQIAEHEAKLAEYIQNPQAYDNQNRLRNASSEAHRQAIFDGRVVSLQEEIAVLRNTIEKVRGPLPR